MPDEIAEKSSDVLPWERRSTMDLEKAFLQTVAAFLHPRKAWGSTPESGGLAGPLLFAALCGLVGALFTATYDLILFQWMVRHRPAFRSGQIHWLTSRALLPLSKLNILISPVVNGVLVVFFVFVVAALIHVGVLLVGARKRSTSGFEGSFRAVAYAAAGLVGQIVPLLGSGVAFIWCLVLIFPGVARMHRISIGRAAAAVILALAIPVLLVLAVASQL